MVSQTRPAPEVMARTDPKPSHNPERTQTITDMDFDESFDEEDDFSDDDCEMEEAFNFNSVKEDDVTNQLLQFAEMVNGDIQKYFGRKKGEEDSCDIYEDKWTSRKSGRELYYADLLRVAQGDDGEDKRKPEDSKDSARANAETYSGRMDISAGLGPLEELFERSVKETRKSPSDVKARKCSGSLSNRTFPDSFWTEPKTISMRKTPIPTKEVHKQDNNAKPQNGLLSQSKTPDFTDLLESWTGEDGGQLGPTELGQHGGVVTQEAVSKR